jgi:hypothetical protein
LKILLENVGYWLRVTQKSPRNITMQTPLPVFLPPNQSNFLPKPWGLDKTLTVA